MVDFKKLANKRGDRKVREVVFAEGETIRVFEPDHDDINAIIKYQEKFVDVENPEKITVDGRDVIKLFGILTDIQGMDDLTEEEIQYVIENPSLGLLQTQHIVEGIVTDVYKMVILSAKNRILEADLQLETARTSRDVLERTLGMAERDGEHEEVAKKVREAQQKVVDFNKRKQEAMALPTDEDETPVSEELVEQEPVEQIGNYDNELARFRSTFGDSEEE